MVATRYRTSLVLLAMVVAAGGCTFYQDLDRNRQGDSDAGTLDAFESRPCDPDCDKTQVAGQLVFIEDGRALHAPNPTGAVCVAAAAGPCSLQVFAFDALAWLQEPAAAMALAEVPITDQGELVSTTIATPALGYMSLVARARSGVDGWVPSAVILSATAGQVTSGLRVPVVTTAVDEMWTSSAGQPFGGQTFAERGAAFVRFTETAGPRSGVTLALPDGADVAAADTFYFADSGSSDTVDPAAARTGVLGTAVMINRDLQQYTGRGNAPTGCEWASVLSDSVPGTIIHTEIPAVSPATGDRCP